MIFLRVIHHLERKFHFSARFSYVRLDIEIAYAVVSSGYVMIKKLLTGRETLMHQTKSSQQQSDMTPLSIHASNRLWIIQWMEVFFCFIDFSIVAVNIRNAHFMNWRSFYVTVFVLFRRQRLWEFSLGYYDEFGLKCEMLRGELVGDITSFCDNFIC